jgi:hypothetical protein
MEAKRLREGERGQIKCSFWVTSPLDTPDGPFVTAQFTRPNLPFEF